MAAGFSVKDALNKNSKAGIDESPRARFRTKDISIFKMYRNDMNFYSVADIEELAGDILLSGLKQNLELVYAPCEKGEYRIVAGERRWEALKYLVSKGYKDFELAITTYRCEMVFDSLNKGISVYEKYGEDRGAYFIERLNLKRLQVQSNSYDFATRLIPIGKDGLMLNIDGKNYVENHQYSKKVKTMTWKDERYTDAESLKEDAEAKLDELSKPYRSYTAEIINLVEAVQDEEKKEQYKEVFSIALGDTVLLISKSTGIRESHRIVKFYEYPLTKEKNKVELANTRLSFEEVQRTEQELS